MTALRAPGRLRSVTAILFVMAMGVSGAAQVITVATQAVTEQRYNQITFLTTGPASWFSDGEQRDRLLRLIVHEAELAYDPPTLRVETLTYGDEGCCNTLVRARDIDFAAEVTRTFGPFPAKPFATFQFGRWLSPTSVEFTDGGARLVMSDLHEEHVKIQRADNR